MASGPNGPILLTQGQMYDDHTKPHRVVTVPQLSLFIVWIGAIVVYFIKIMFGRPPNKNGHVSPAKEGNNNGQGEFKIEITENSTSESGSKIHQNGSKLGLKEGGNGGDTTVAKAPPPSNVKPPPSFEAFLQYVVVFGAIMIYFFLCDYYKIWAPGKRTYDRDLFLFLVFLLFLVAGAFTIRPCKPQILNRDQTEEWKGWMQVMFVWYHYFAAKEWYNWIRIYIAAYVWMTGFGNFSFFWVRGDFSLWRVLKMLFRLNFLVVFICAVVDNEYMLYYICAMHTYWFLSVYVFMRCFNSWNTDRYKMALKFLVYAICNAIIFEIPGVSEIVFKPLWFILGFHDDRFTLMHEWAFRAGLDHWACFIGMLCAYNYPHFEALMKNLESQSEHQVNKYSNGIKIGIATICVFALVVWYQDFMTLEKFDYNAIHPYTSWIFIVGYIILRNISVTFRSYYIHMFAWLGKITLETYLSQLHVWLQANAKDLIIYISDYHMLNFAFSTVIYLIISYMLFHLTTEFSAFLFPKDYKEMTQKIVVTAVVFIVASIMGCVVHWTMYG